jgi:hypothetical protein
MRVHLPDGGLVLPWHGPEFVPAPRRRCPEPLGPAWASPAHDSSYRATVEGPGVTPDVMWSDDDIGSFDQLVQDQMRALEWANRVPRLGR